MATNNRALITALNEASRAFGPIQIYRKSVIENTKGLISLRDPIVKLTNVAVNLADSVERADGLQEKSLALNTNLSKILSKNDKTLSELRGSFFDNAEELIKNLEEGIVDNIDGLNKLQNRMRLTGQSSDAARKVYAELLIYTGMNTAAVDKSAKLNLEISKKSVVSNEKLLGALDSLASNLDSASLLDSVAGLEDLSKALIAQTKGLGQDQLKKVNDLFLNPDRFAERIRLGLVDSQGDLADKLQDTSLGTEAKLVLVKNALDKISNLVAQNVKSSNGTYQSLRNSLLSRAYSDEATLAAAKNLNSILNKNSNSLSDLATSTDNFAMTLKNQYTEFFNFYQEGSTKVYDILVKWLPAIAAAGTGAAAGGILGKIGGGLAGGVRTGLRAGAWGALAGGILGGLAPIITQWMTSSEEESKDTKKLVKHIESLDKKQPPLPTSEKTPDVISSLSDAIVSWKTNEDNRKRSELDNNKAVVDRLDALIKILSKKSQPIEFKTGL